MKNAPSTTSHESIILHEQFILIEHYEEPHVHDPEKDDIVVTQNSTIQWTAKSFGDDYIVYLVDDILRTIEEAYSSPNANFWKEAIWSEMDSIMSNRTWELLNALWI
jgi:hypothetical protein